MSRNTLPGSGTTAQRRPADRRGTRRIGALAAASTALLAVAHLVINQTDAARADLPMSVGLFAWVYLPSVSALGLGLATLALTHGWGRPPRGLLVGLVWTYTIVVAGLVVMSLLALVAGAELTLAFVFNGPFAYALVSLIAYGVLHVRLWADRAAARRSRSKLL
ncbi:MAG: hypothetical protein M0026_15450 [Nocardiopsaceae bacterium]|nr:hypothetical protein [Nocardiopsaceae bacterium]